jgi:hypothetical protein
MKNIKANFNEIYSQYCPTEYVNYLVGELKYELPFHAMERLKIYHQTLLPIDDLIQVTMVGSAHGLEAASLKFDVTPQDILTRWTNDATVMLSFPSQSKYEITMIDIEAEPLRFASDIKLCEKSFVANMQQPYSVQLEQHLNEMTDIVICIGATGYIGVDGVEKIINSAFLNGKAKLFCFSIGKHLDEKAFIEVCLKYGLVVRMIGSHFQQRCYQDETEKQKMHQVLKQKNIMTQADENAITCNVFLSYKPDIFPVSYNGEIAPPKTLIVATEDNDLIGCTTENSADLNNLPHPWHIVLSKAHSESADIHRQLTHLHVRGKLLPSDMITMVKSPLTNHLSHLAKMFPDDYQTSEQTLSNGLTRQTFIKV